MTDRVITYAQNREDIIIRAFFPSGYKGFYVDVGAAHPTIGSVTKLLYDEGWRGVNIDPNEELYGLLKNERSEDENVNVGISDKEDTLVFRQYASHGLSTFSDSMKNTYANEKNAPKEVKKYIDRKIRVTTLANLLDGLDISSTIDVLKIDIEGLEYEALNGNNWEKYSPKLICIEANHIIKDWRLILKLHGYQLVFFDGLNEYYVSSMHKELIGEFSYVDKILLGPPIINFVHQREISELTIENTSLRIDLEDARAFQFSYESNLQEIMWLRSHIAQLNRGRNQLKGLLFSIDGKIIYKLRAKSKMLKRYPTIHIDGKIIDKSALDLYKLLHQADQSSFVVPLPPHKQFINFIIGIPLAVYMSITRPFIALGRLVLSAYRRYIRKEKVA